jgi:hypothetical protein
MKTDDLIQLIAADHAAPRPDLRTRVIAAALIGATLSFGVLLLGYGLRPELGSALLTWRVATKFAIALTVAVTGAALAYRLTRPEADTGSARLILAPAPLILAMAGIGELASTAPGSWAQSAVGANPYACLLGVPLLSALPLAGILWALRDGAPAVPAQLGAAAGAAAAGIGAAIYALHCQDDSPLFLAVWYVLATGMVVAAGRAGGGRLLRW